jgi:hypothetical protein
MFAAVEFPEASLFLSGALIHETGYLPTILHSLTVLARARLAFNFGTDRLRSILKPTTEEIVAQLIQQGLAPDTARRCADLFDEVEWHNAQLPLRRRCFSGGKRPVFGCALAARSAGSRAHARGTRTCVDTRGTRPGNWFVARCIRSHFQCLKDSRLPKKSGSSLRCFVEPVGRRNPTGSSACSKHLPLTYAAPLVPCSRRDNSVPKVSVRQCASATLS